MIFTSPQVFSVLFDGYLLIDYKVRLPGGSVLFHKENNLLTHQGFIIPVNPTSYGSQNIIFRMAVTIWLGLALEDFKSSFEKREWAKPIIESLKEELVYLESRTMTSNISEYMIDGSGILRLVKMKTSRNGGSFNVHITTTFLGDAADIRGVFSIDNVEGDEYNVLQFAVEQAEDKESLLADLQRHGLFKGCDWVPMAHYREKVEISHKDLLESFMASHGRYMKRVLHQYLKDNENIPKSAKKKIEEIFFSIKHMQINGVA